MTWPRRACWWCGRTVAHTPTSGRPTHHHNGDQPCYGVANAPATVTPRATGVHLPESDVEATDA